MNRNFMSKPFAAELTNVSKNYMLGKTPVPVLCSVSLNVYQGEFLVITGPSGSGKSTLLNVLSGIDYPNEGTVSVGGENITSMSDRQLTDFRLSNIGFVFQNFNLLSVMTVLENVEYPLQLSNLSRSTRLEMAMEIVRAVGLGGMADRKPNELSGGQRQRVAIARALVKKPALVVADEPTANLDRATGAEIISLMREMQSASRTTFVFSSHDPHLIQCADRVVTLDDGKVNMYEQYQLTKTA